jgi:galactose mutarotase-like enzyme
MRASSELDHLQVYRPPGVPWLCVEPVSQATGAWSLPQVHQASAGLRWLPPGGEFQGWMALSVSAG